MKGHCFVKKEGFKQIRREGDNANMIFRFERSLMFRVSHSILLIPNSAKLHVCADLKSLEVQVPLIFFGKGGFLSLVKGRW